MIRLERTTEDQPELGCYDDVKVQIAGGFENTTEDWIRFVVGFLMQAGFYHYQIVEAMKEYVELAQEE